jgi:hypothetical protein
MVTILRYTLPPSLSINVTVSSVILPVRVAALKLEVNSVNEQFTVAYNLLICLFSSRSCQT